MRIPLRVLAVASVAAIPAIPAVAIRPTTPPTKPAKPCKPAPRAGVAYILRGVIQADVTDPTAVSVKLIGGNRWGHWAVKNATPPVGEDKMITVDAGGTCTKINKVVVHKHKVHKRIVVHRHLRRQGSGKLDMGDRVLIKWRAPRKTALQDLGPAWRVVELARR